MKTTFKTYITIEHDKPVGDFDMKLILNHILKEWFGKYHEVERFKKVKLRRVQIIESQKDTE